MIENTEETVTQGRMRDIPTEKIDRYGNHEHFACLKQTQLNPKNTFNLFSETKAMVNDWNLSGNDRDGIIIRKGEFEVKFDIRINTSEGCVWATYFRRTQSLENELATASVATKLSIQKSHDILGQSNEEATRATAKYLKWSLTRGALKNCEF